VLDEADRMLDMGFIEDIEHIVSKTPESRQTLLFSATLDGMVGKLAMNMTRSPKRIEVATREEHKANIDQRLLFTDDVGHKRRLLDVLLRDVELTQAVIFTATKMSADDLSESLLEQGFSAAALHGDMPQHKRNRTLQRLRDGQIKLLVATDVAARGIDVAGISHVINFDAPRQAEDYVHRIGRTGRAGRTGIAVTFIAGRERGLVRDIERFTGQPVRVDVIAGHEPQARPERSFSGKPRSGGGKDWGNKPRSSSGGGYQGRGGSWAGQNAGQGQGYAGRGRSDDTRGSSFGAPAASAGNGGGWQGKPDSREARPAWNKPDARPVSAKPAHSWDRPEKTSSWSKPEVRPAYKGAHSQNEDHRPAATKPRGRQSW
jgi:superfamily II DNA/RNA helicase